MNIIKKKTLLLATLFIFGLNSQILLATPTDFSGVFETKVGWADEFFGMGGINYFDCSIRVDLACHFDTFTVNSIVVKCDKGNEKFRQFTPKIDFNVNERGDLSNQFGTGKIDQNLVKFQIEDAYDGIHYFNIELKKDILYFGWSYEGEVGSAFDISGGKMGLIKTSF